MLDAIDHLFGMIPVISTLQASVHAMAFTDDSTGMVLFASQQHMFFNTFILTVLQLLQQAIQAYFARRRLGADSSGGMNCGAMLGVRGPPPRASDWGDAQCVRHTRFTVAQIHTLLHGFEMLHPDGTSKVYHVFQSDKLYRKRQRSGMLSHSCAKFFYVDAETALLVLLVNLARPIAYCDMQQSLNGIPSPEISHIVNFILTYMEPWYSVTQDLSLFLSRFHLYANAIVGRGSRIGAGGINCWVVGFTDGTLIQTCRPHGNGNIFKQIHDFQQFNGKSKGHGHKFLGLSFPDGSIAMYGPYAGPAS